jgi:hypothetical protein
LFPRIRTTTIFPATNTEITTEDFLKLLLKAKKIELKTKNDFLSKSVLALTAVINGYDEPSQTKL